uniref:Fibrillar collagen NC1 domain-containing protein n=1 Tax=Knipowitschia caucasica TaxID=637954 RepID=A0AAV2LES5_KNICA
MRSVHGETVPWTVPRSNGDHTADPEEPSTGTGTPEPEGNQEHLKSTGSTTRGYPHPEQSEGPDPQQEHRDTSSTHVRGTDPSGRASSTVSRRGPGCGSTTPVASGPRKGTTTGSTARKNGPNRDHQEQQESQVLREPQDEGLYNPLYYRGLWEWRGLSERLGLWEDRAIQEKQDPRASEAFQDQRVQLAPQALLAPQDQVGFLGLSVKEEMMDQLALQDFRWGLAAVGVSPLPYQGRRRRAHISVDGAALEEEQTNNINAIDIVEELQGDQPEQSGKAMQEVFASLSSMKVDVEGLRNPQGTYLSPARSCKELWLLQPQLPNGDYWIDPNQGCHRDAFKVFCNFTAQGETCLHPDKKFQAVKLAGWKGEKPGSWYSHFRKGRQFSYSGSDGTPVHVVQLNFLKLLSATAKQSFTYHCLNSAAWLHSATYTHQYALRFRGSDGEELKQENTHYINALYDGCQSRSGQERTLLEIHAPHSNSLPIVDVAVSDFGNTNQKFGFQVGPVCFNG